jgi:hypothetical protein
MDACRLEGWGPQRRLIGSALFSAAGRPQRLDYTVVCDAAWRTRSALVEGWSGRRTLRISLRADRFGRWTVDGRQRPSVLGCVDVDFGFTPATNLLPIRRLGLEVGEEARVRSAWLEAPGADLLPLSQSYRRVGATTYRYRCGRFTTDLEVDRLGFVLSYGEAWTCVARG